MNNHEECAFDEVAEFVMPFMAVEDLVRLSCTRREYLKEVRRRDDICRYNWAWTANDGVLEGLREKREHSRRLFWHTTAWELRVLRSVLGLSHRYVARVSESARGTYRKEEVTPEGGRAVQFFLARRAVVPDHSETLLNKREFVGVLEDLARDPTAQAGGTVLAVLQTLCRLQSAFFSDWLEDEDEDSADPDHTITSTARSSRGSIAFSRYGMERCRLPDYSPIPNFNPNDDSGLAGEPDLMRDVRRLEPFLPELAELRREYNIALAQPSRLRSAQPQPFHQAFSSALESHVAYLLPLCAELLWKRIISLPDVITPGMRAIDAPATSTKEHATTLLRALNLNSFLCEPSEFSPGVFGVYVRRAALQIWRGLGISVPDDIAAVVTPTWDLEFPETAPVLAWKQAARDAVSSMEVSRVVQGIRGVLEAADGDLALKGNLDDYYSVRNSLMHRWPTSRSTIPLVLSCTFVVVAAEVGLVGASVIGAPRHVLASVENANESVAASDGPVNASTETAALLHEMKNPLADILEHDTLPINLEQQVRTRQYVDLFYGSVHSFDGLRDDHEVFSSSNMPLIWAQPKFFLTMSCKEVAERNLRNLMLANEMRWANFSEHYSCKLPTTVYAKDTLPLLLSLVHLEAHSSDQIHLSGEQLSRLSGQFRNVYEWRQMDVIRSAQRNHLKLAYFTEHLGTECSRPLPLPPWLPFISVMLNPDNATH